MKDPEDNNKKSLSANEVKEFDDIFDSVDEMETLIKQTMKDMFGKERLKRKLREGAEAEALVQTCSEFMNSFIIMGYNTRNEPIEPIFYCRNEMEADALSHYLQKFFISSQKDLGGPDSKP